MQVSAAVLRTLHRIHRQRTDLRERLAQGPKQIRAAETAHARLETALEEARQLTRQMRVSADQKQLQLREREGRLLDLRGKLNAASSNREYQALLEQIAADEQANNVLSDEILELLEKVDAQQITVAEMQAQAERAKEELAALRGRVDAERQGLEGELARVGGELAEVEQGLPPDFKAEYNRMVKAKGEDALAPLETEDGGSNCGGCYQRVTAQVVNELRMERLVFCKSCGRLLYLPEGE